ncbi:MAG TPA: YraN family protein [Bryobacteraceae bacterium]|nr:YraN family protein [Bryobacteraceae bacterium]
MRFFTSASHYFSGGNVLGFLYSIADAVRRRHYKGDHGRIGEDLAHGYLRRRGCKVVARNYRTGSGAGEVDLVVWDGPALAFVEVKTRATADYGAPDQAVDAEKRRRIQIGANTYARRAGIPLQKIRLDIVSIVMQPRLQIDWQRDAFGLREQSSLPQHAPRTWGSSDRSNAGLPA